MDDSGLSPNELPSGCLASAPARRSVGTGYRAGDALQGILVRLFLRSCLTIRDGLGTCPDELSLPSAPTGAGVRHDPDKALSFEYVPPCRASPVTAEPRAV